MSGKHLKTPLPVIASTIKWRYGSAPTTPAVRITGERGTVIVGVHDLEQLARATSEALSQKIAHGVKA